MPIENTGKIYSATYSNVPVYEYNADGNHVMRRRVDDWINATHILKVADYDKPARTRILEREVQKGVHEKVQGGYGKYQGTWIPLTEGRDLAQRNGVLEKLLPIFDFVPGDRSPPPAPKHATAASSRPRAPRQSAAVRRAVPGRRKIPVGSVGNALEPLAPSQQSEEHFEQLSTQLNDETPDNVSIVTDSIVDEQDLFPSQYSNTGGGRKRKRGLDQMSAQERDQQIWSDALLDYFMLLDTVDRLPAPPDPPPGIDLDRPIDEKGHAALHWAAAMGDVDVVQDLIRRGAKVDCVSNSLETPLIRAVLFTNNFDKQTMPKMVQIFHSTVFRADWYGSTVFHHITATTSSKNKYVCARYYLDTILDNLSETWNPADLTRLLNMQDQHGDTAIMIAARNGARKCVRTLLGRNVALDIQNSTGQTADDLIRDLNHRRRDPRHRAGSSSPFGPVNGDIALFPSSVAPPTPSQPTYRSQTANTLMTKIAPTLLEKVEQLAAAYEAELEEKELENAEADRVIRKREAEIEATKKAIKELQGTHLGINGLGDEDLLDERLEQELRTLEREAEALLEVEQRAELHSLVQLLQQPQNLNRDHHDRDPELAKAELAKALALAQLERRKLVQEIVGALAAAGVGERHAEYKRLIVGALGVSGEDVEGMLPEVLGELEEGERERLEGCGA
ncbi:apses-domain-containing protein [Patellaria atrata CBS 101060]|uniref:Apses-domain-containing protein n=1 Tax=Patellaria atrata CBS 101060 TaxID=1346257 RepID=A0A9P4S951_9PEZI|nr:apses-domain-containing protein [Patellaria atrata CBS 101060]